MWLKKKMMSKEAWWRISPSSFRWKRLDLQTTIVDTVVFKVVSVVEGVVLVSTLCFFFLCCGCQF
ncbi:putative transmembrane protein [Senna tora]|uniref:Putative transmembrane protein n=1 Tax=Senna tora TaxID=362788 RepID=A0A834WX27_9FABA|nr:putative transmembrane protein [Senna tora]